MKGLYIAAIDSYNHEHVGIYNKILGQVKGFKENKFDISYIIYKNQFIYYNEQNTNVKFVKSIGYNLHKFLIHNSYYFNEVDFVYIRYSIGDYQFYKLLKLLKKMNIKIIVEIATWPYRYEQKKGIKNVVKSIIDRYIAKRINKYIYRISVTTKVKSIYDVDCINIFNGIDLNNIPIIKKVQHDGINLIGIANVSLWHGYDRLIRGIADYYNLTNEKQENINFYIVGNGTELENLKKLSKNLSIENKIHFTGVKRGKELDDFINSMDIGVSSLALHRIKAGDPIKTKEFIARGLPTILGYNDQSIESSFKYIFEADQDETAIDVKSVLEWYYSVDLNAKYIRKYAEQNLDWSSQIKKIVEVLR
ncbi:glycosyltransferase [Clostridium intestinale]|uniref:Glycosyltransferase involved in cell wall bisynthesis n=1 Tax=Clostridium intestinale DSM 6191 TaxID=1121320 RepID=A0A1M6DLA5_9CLOT|nr:glycosyltransferase [Clostridium intestinale]SHI73975.1 Glycosyltransferase involved in cell wall bisynthesis [Clostridium intestinale DSM 6191]